MLYISALGARDFWAPVEPRYAEIARAMFVKREWIVPTINGDLYTDKPILYFWLALIGARVFGAVNEWTVRLPAALGGVGFVFGTYLLGRDFFNGQTGFIAAAILATTMRVVWEARWAHVDMVFCAFFVFAVYFGARAFPQRPATRDIVHLPVYSPGDFNQGADRRCPARTLVPRSNAGPARMAADFCAKAPPRLAAVFFDRGSLVLLSNARDRWKMARRLYLYSSYPALHRGRRASPTVLLLFDHAAGGFPALDDFSDSRAFCLSALSPSMGRSGRAVFCAVVFLGILIFYFFRYEARFISVAPDADIGSVRGKIFR